MLTYYKCNLLNSDAKVITTLLPVRLWFSTLLTQRLHMGQLFHISRRKSPRIDLCSLDCVFDINDSDQPSSILSSTSLIHKNIQVLAYQHTHVYTREEKRLLVCHDSQLSQNQNDSRPQSCLPTHTEKCIRCIHTDIIHVGMLIQVKNEQCLQK